MHVLRKIREKYRYGLVIEVILSVLKKIGVCIEPVLFYQEGVFLDYLEYFEDCITDYEVGFLGREDMKLLGEIKDRTKDKEESLLARLEEGKKCFGLKSYGEIAAYTWCVFESCKSELLEFPLKEDDVYLYDAYTLKAFRGRRIAPYLRFKCYHELQKMGYGRFFSYSSVFNKPSIRFKQKLNARPLLLGLKLTIRNSWSRKWVIKNYNHSNI